MVYDVILMAHLLILCDANICQPQPFRPQIIRLCFATPPLCPETMADRKAHEISFCNWVLRGFLWELKVNQEL